MTPAEIVSLCTKVSTQVVSRMLAPFTRRVRLMIGRAVVTTINDGGRIQTAQVKLLEGEVREGVEVLMQYGLHSNPPGKREGIYLSVGADRDHGVLINVSDRQFRMTSLASGEVALQDDLGQTVHLSRNGIVIDGAALPILITNTPKVRVETPMFEVTGEIKDRCDTDGRTMESMRTIYDSHTHHENDSAGDTDVPTQKML